MQCGPMSPSRACQMARQENRSGHELSWWRGRRFGRANDDHAATATGAASRATAICQRDRRSGTGGNSSRRRGGKWQGLGRNDCQLAGRRGASGHDRRIEAALGAVIMLAEMCETLRKLHFPAEHDLPHDEFVQLVTELRTARGGQPLWTGPNEFITDETVIPSTIMLRGCLVRIKTA